MQFSLSYDFQVHIFFIPSLFNLCVSFSLKRISCRQHIYCRLLFFHPICHFIYLIGVFSPLTFKVIIDMYLLPFKTLLPSRFCISSLFLFFPFPFVVWWLSFVLCLSSFCFLCINYVFLFVATLFFKYINPLMYLLAWDWYSYGLKKKILCFLTSPTLYDFDVVSNIFMFILLLFIAVTTTLTKFCFVFKLCTALFKWFSNRDFLFPIDSCFFSMYVYI